MDHKRIAIASERLDRARDERDAANLRRNQFLRIEGPDGPRARDAETALQAAQRAYDEAARDFQNTLKS